MPERKGGFTLIEILVVISIILILSAMTVYVVGELKYKSRAALTRAEISTMAIAIAQYESIYGRYPADLPDCSSRALIEALGGDYKSNPPKKALYDFAKDRVVNGEFLSLFRKPFYYRENASERDKNGEMKKPFAYDIWTDDIRKRPDGINNWEK
ncbi:MAG: prepilin-type N-terminal cleavage/methylation domain-containing protein [Planctomycetes bacterium]|nr:prepilin-type N-terminal cleavage/methylation domain-containing protein [Planctomycetota bacterium]